MVRELNREGVPQPRDETLFPRCDEPVDLEIGCGAGLHPIQYALANPERRIVAIEHTHTRFGLFAGRLKHHPQATNLVAIHDDAIAWVTHRVPEGSLSRVFLLYPNPYPKPKHLNKRWYAMPFMGELLASLMPGGTLTLATNEGFYAEEARQWMTGEWGTALVEDRVLRVPAGEKTGGRTHFERKYLARGEACYDLVFQKKD